MAKKKLPEQLSDGISANEPLETVSVKPSRHVKRIILSVVAVTLVIFTTLAVLYFGGAFNSGNSSVGETDSVTDEPFVPSSATPKDAVEAYIHAITVERSVDALTECVHEDIISSYIEENYDGDRDAFESTMNMSFSLLADVTASYFLSEPRELSNYELEAASKYYDDTDEYSFAAVNVALSLKGTMAEEEVDESSSTTYITVQLDGKWYVDLRLVR